MTILPFNIVLRVKLYFDKLFYLALGSSPKNNPNNKNFLLANRVRKINNLLMVKNQKVKIKRFGSRNDGGYFLADNFDKNTLLVSAGIGYNCDFEKSLIKKVKNAILIDPHIDKYFPAVPNYKMYKKRLGSKTEGSTVSLDFVLGTFPNDKVILKIDIEGSEYSILDKISHKQLLRIDQLIVEFHNLTKIYDDRFYFKLIQILKRIRETHNLALVTPNNYSISTILGGEVISDVLETLFINKALNFPKKLSDKQFKLTSNNPNLPNHYFPTVTKQI